MKLTFNYPLKMDWYDNINVIGKYTCFDGYNLISIKVAPLTYGNPDHSFCFLKILQLKNLYAFSRFMWHETQCRGINMSLNDFYCITAVTLLSIKWTQITKKYIVRYSIASIISYILLSFQGKIV